MLHTSDTSSCSPIAAASTLDELLAHYDQSFIVCAYHTLLGRAPDPEGLGYYLSKLRTGSAKIQLLEQMRLSKEGKAYAKEISGLEIAIQRYKRGRYPVIGCLFRLFYRTESNQSSERKLRTIENHLFLLREESNRRLDQIEAALAALHCVVAQQKKFVVTMPDGVFAQNRLSESIISNESSIADEFKLLSIRAQDIYIQLIKAAAKNSEKTI